MNKKSLRALIYSLGLVGAATLSGCVDSNNGSSIESTPESSDKVDSEKKAFLLTIEGSKIKGEVVTIIIKDELNEVVENASVRIIEGESLVSLNGNQLTLVEVGHVKIEVSKVGFTSKELEFDIEDIPLAKMNVAFEGKFFHGETIGVVIKENDGNIIEDCRIDIIKGGDIAYARGNSIILLDSGEVSGIISKEGYEDVPFSFTSKAVTGIKDIKENINEYNGKLVTVRGKISACYSNSFYLMDGKNGFYVYNMNALDSTYETGDGFKDNKVIYNEAVLVTAIVDNGSYGLQLAGNYQGDFIPEGRVYKSNMTVNEPICYEINKESDLLGLNAAPILAGSRIKVTGKYISGDFSSVEQTGAKDAIFDFQYGTVPFQAKFNKRGSLETVKSYWNKEKIETGDYVSIEANFTNYKGTISIDLTDEGTKIHNESKDKNNIIVTSSESSVVVGKSITLTATLPDGMEGEPTFEIIKGKENATLEGNTLTGKKAGQVNVVAKLNDKTSMPIEIIVTEGSYSSISSIRDMAVGAEVDAVGKIIGFYKNGFLIQDDTGYLYCIVENDFYPHEVKLNDTVKVKGVRYDYQKRLIPTINQVTFEVTVGIDVTTTYSKVTQADFKNFTEEELKYGKAVEVELSVDKFNKTSGILNGSGYFLADPSDAAGTGYYFFSWGNDKYLQVLTTSIVKAVVYYKTTQPSGFPSYVLMVTEAKEKIINPETITLQLENSQVDNQDPTLSSSKTFASIEVNPVGASKKYVELVAIEGADLVKIETYSFGEGRDFKITAMNNPGVVKLQAQTKDGKVKSNIVELTIVLYVPGVSD